jgi:hypothetical protein
MSDKSLVRSGVVEEERCHWVKGAAKHEELVEVWVTPGGIGMIK